MDFIVLKVNGRDLSKASHDEALEAFCSAKEPIVVEVLRRTTKSPATRPNMELDSPAVTSPESPVCCDSSTQTEWTGGWESPPMGLFPFSQTSLVQSAAHQMALFGSDVMDHHYETLGEELDQEEEEEEEEEEEGCELEYEEVTLHRGHSEEKLGLTLCYAAPDDNETDIFVSEIEPDSVASRDGSIQEGDQLLQINGVDVHNRRQAIALFSSKEPEITLLVARPHLQEDEEDDFDEQEENNLQVFSNRMMMMEAREDDAVTSDTGTAEIFPRHEKDSGVGRTDGSTRNDESSDHEDGPDTAHRHLMGSLKVCCYSNGDVAGATTSAQASLPPHCDPFQEALEQKCASTSTTSLADAARTAPPPPYYHPHLVEDSQQQDGALPRVQSDNSLDREMALLNQEMQNIQVECESLVSRHIREQWFRCQAGHSYVTYGELMTTHSAAAPLPGSLNTNGERRRLPEPPAPPPPPPPPPQQQRHQVDKKESVAQWVKSVAFEKKSKGVLSKLLMGVEEKERDSSSAYNTGESSRSTPLTLELAPLPHMERTSDFRGSMMSLIAHPRLVDKSTQLHESDVASVVSCDTCRYCQALAHQDHGSADVRFAHLQNHHQQQQQPQQQQHPFWSGLGPVRTSGGNTGSMSRKLSFKLPEEGSKDFIDRQGERNRNYVTFYPCATMYTNHENLQHTIWLQQQLFRQALAQQHYKKATTIPTCAPLCAKDFHSQKHPSLPPFSSPITKVIPDKMSVHPPFLPPPPLFPHPPSSPSRSPGGLCPVREDDCPNEPHMEWKVKRRPDGTRYITRRPIRNKILKERAMKIMEERCGLTTDDDAISELKVGRYWSKEDRKRHLEKARDRKQRREVMMRAKMTSLKERVEERDDSSQGRKDSLVDAASSSHKRTVRRKGKSPSAPSSAVMEDSPCAEAMVHGVRGQSSGAKSLGLLSVTTV